MKTSTEIPEGLFEKLAGEGYNTELKALLQNQQIILDIEQYCREKILVSVQILLPRKIFKKRQDELQKAKDYMETANIVKKRIYEFVNENKDSINSEIDQIIKKRIENDRKFFTGVFGTGQNQVG